MDNFEIDRALKTFTILVDSREQDTARSRERYRAFGVPYECCKLDFGDYSAKVTDDDGNEISLCNRLSVERKMNLDEARFHMCLSGQRMIEIMNSARHQYKQNPDETIKKLCTASKLDTFGIKENTFYLCVMEGEKNGVPAKFKMTVSGLGPSPMTGVSAGAATLCFAKEKKSCGTILLGESDLATPIIDSLIANQPEFSCEIKDMLTTEIEGEI